jgi:hypothetical protein
VPFELAVGAAINLFGFNSGAALATVVGMLVAAPVMLSGVDRRSQPGPVRTRRQPEKQRAGPPRSLRKPSASRSGLPCDTGENFLAPNA